eukprot:7298394-Alexandrium_andersonii.AAC.1
MQLRGLIVELQPVRCTCLLEDTRCSSDALNEPGNCGGSQGDSDIVHEGVSGISTWAAGWSGSLAKEVPAM